MRELFYDRNPGDARVKVVLEGKFFVINVGVAEIGYTTIRILSGGPSKIGPSV